MALSARCPRALNSWSSAWTWRRRTSFSSLPSDGSGCSTTRARSSMISIRLAISLTSEGPVRPTRSNTPIQGGRYERRLRLPRMRAIARVGVSQRIRPLAPLTRLSFVSECQCSAKTYVRPPAIPIQQVGYLRQIALGLARPCRDDKSRALLRVYLDPLNSPRPLSVWGCNSLFYRDSRCKTDVSNSVSRLAVESLRWSWARST